MYKTLCIHTQTHLIWLKSQYLSSRKRGLPNPISPLMSGISSSGSLLRFELPLPCKIIWKTKGLMFYSFVLVNSNIYHWSSCEFERREAWLYEVLHWHWGCCRRLGFFPTIQALFILNSTPRISSHLFLLSFSYVFKAPSLAHYI